MSEVVAPGVGGNEQNTSAVGKVIAPKGMEHVGWYCDHENSGTVHRSEQWSVKKQAPKLKKMPNTIESMKMLNKYREELLCPIAVPMFVVVGS